MSLVDKIKSNKLVKQVLNFGIVGILAFIVEFVCLNILIKWGIPLFVPGRDEGFYTLVASPIAFSISVIFNYIMSILFVFKKRQDVNGGQVFIIFIVLNVVALGLNQLVMWLFVKYLPAVPYNIAKIVATGFVTIYNFISRKIFIEDHSEKVNDEK